MPCALYSTCTCSFWKIRFKNIIDCQNTLAPTISHILFFMFLFIIFGAFGTFKHFLCSHSSVLTSVSSDRGDSVKGKALYDFDATEGKEISVLTGQVCGKNSNSIIL